jgi:hypothetical protein
VFFLTLLGVKMLLLSSVIFRNFNILLSFSFSYDTEVPRYLNVFTYSILLLSITTILRKKIAPYSENRTKHINITAHREQNTESLIVKADDTC